MRFMAKDKLIPGATRKSYKPGASRPADESGKGWVLDTHGEHQYRNDWVESPAGPVISGSSEYHAASGGGGGGSGGGSGSSSPRALSLPKTDATLFGPEAGPSQPRMIGPKPIIASGSGTKPSGPKPQVVRKRGRSQRAE